MRLEGWPKRKRLWPSFETPRPNGAKAPQDEGLFVGSALDQFVAGVGNNATRDRVGPGAHEDNANSASQDEVGTCIAANQEKRGTPVPEGEINQFSVVGRNRAHGDV